MGVKRNLDQSKDDSLKISEGTSKDDSLKISEGTPKDDSLKISEGTSKDDSPKISEGTSKDDSITISEGASKDDSPKISEGTSKDDSPKISEDEAALYDRQIRLWGMECQKRLREAKILVIGLNGVTAEAVKNLTLSGIKQITIHDDTEVKNMDFAAQLFLSSDKLGKPRSVSSVSAIRELNPNVKIDISTGDIFSKAADFYQEFHAMVVTDCSSEILIKLNELCREHGLQFYCTDVWGFYGYCFLDLADHTFKDFINQRSKEVKVSLKKEKLEPTKVEMKRKYCPLGPTLSVKVGQGLRKRVNRIFILFHMMNHFREKFNRLPHPESRDLDFDELKMIRYIICQKLDFDVEKIHDEMLSCMFGQLSPACSIVGGVLANEIIKGITRDGLPVYNYFFFDGNEYVGLNELIRVE